jgi:hypothetical protein
MLWSRLGDDLSHRAIVAFPPIDVFARESVVVLLGCSTDRLIGSPASLGCSSMLLGGRVGRQLKRPDPLGLNYDTITSS